MYNIGRKLIAMALILDVYTFWWWWVEPAYRSGRLALCLFEGFIFMIGWFLNEEGI